jgi:hypothetical protein
MVCYDDGVPQSTSKADHFWVSITLYIGSMAQGDHTRA